MNHAFIAIERNALDRGSDSRGGKGCRGQQPEPEKRASLKCPSECAPSDIDGQGVCFQGQLHVEIMARYKFNNYLVNQLLSLLLDHGLLGSHPRCSVGTLPKSSKPATPFIQ
jgi:hypothetical protein